MKKYRKILVLVLVLGLLLSLGAAAVADDALPFEDVEPGRWYYENVCYVWEHGLMNGVSPTQFSPDGQLTRAMAVTILYRAADGENLACDLPFTDLQAGSYYYDAVCWAYNAGITNGRAETSFVPQGEVTRAEFAVFLYRWLNMAGRTLPSTVDGQPADMETVPGWAQDAVLAMYRAEIIRGRPDGRFDPAAPITRAEAAALLDRFERAKLDEPTDPTEPTDPPEENRLPYGVFLGRNGDEMAGMEQYKIVVIEPEEFTKTQIAALHNAGCTVYGYLNIGAVEEYRDYFERFADLSLGVYEDWPDERWVDVSDAGWQAFLTEELAPAYLAMGFDGFFLDNADVYYEFETGEIFEGLCAILRGLRAADPDAVLLINGGDVFVSRCIEEGTAQALFDGVNQETVFTAIDFDDESFHRQDPEETAYFREYLQTVKDAGLRVFLLEYGADEGLAQTIEDYCKENGFLWYNATSLDLR